MILKELLKVASGTLVELEIEAGDMILRTESAYCCIVRRCVCGNRNHKSYCVEKSCWHIGKVPDHGDSERTYQRADDVPAPLHVGKGKRRTEIKWQNRYCLRTLWMIS